MKILVGVVVLSMALTPYLAKLGDRIATLVEEYERAQDYDMALQSGSMGSESASHEEFSDSNVVVICGYDTVGETVVRFLTAPAVEEYLEKGQGSSRSTKYIAFDLDPNLVVKGFKDKKRILYGDGSQVGAI